MKISKKGIEFHNSFEHELLYAFMNFASLFLNSKCSNEIKKIIGKDLFAQYKKAADEIYMTLGAELIKDPIIKNLTENLRKTGG
jgi:hypothetical protein